ncbi:MAG: glycine cleavage system protein GcvH [Alphaproteobacteria bacterium]
MSTKYSKEHEWVSVDGDIATIGITNYAQEQLGDVVFVEVPDSGKAVDKGDETAVVESVKAASEIYAPISGAITEGNSGLEDAPATINTDAETDGWIFKMTIGDTSELDELMDAAAYAEFVAGLE